MNQTEVLNRLKEGNQRYMASKLEHNQPEDAQRSALTGGQSPFAIVLSCADSRVVPEYAFDTGLGELFVVRVAGNIANSSSIASIEYAVAHLNVGVIVVMGHQACGAVTAAVNGGDNGYHLNQLTAHIAPAIAASGPNAELKTVIENNAAASAKALAEQSSIIGGAFNSGKVKIVPAYYNLDSGKVDFLDEVTA